MKQFNELGINDEILESIRELGYDSPTEIQEQTIPLVLEGKDVIAASATGSGKTLAFGCALIQNITKEGGTQGLILTPTRELAQQIYDSLRTLSKHKDLNFAIIYGGVSYGPQFDALSKANIVVGTPGRLLDHLERGTLNLSEVKHLVLDEADRMLDMGFLDDVKKIMSQCRQEKQTMLFSATMPPEVVSISKQFMNDPVKVTVDCYVDPKLLSQVYYDVPNNLKLSLLAQLLQKEMKGLVMVFCNSRRSVDFVAKSLGKIGIDAMGIHGGLTQNRRSGVLAKFNSKKAFVLVCTDVAARGLDIPGVSHIYNYDIPNDSKNYVHRIGRTARAGESGKAINLLSDRDHDNFSRVLRDYDLDIKKMERPYIKKLEISVERKPRFGRQRSNFGKRPSQRGGAHKHKRPRSNNWRN